MAAAAPTERAVILPVSVAVIDTAPPFCDVTEDFNAKASTLLAMTFSELAPEPATETPPPAPPDAATAPEIDNASIVGVEVAEICTAPAEVIVESATYAWIVFLMSLIATEAPAAAARPPPTPPATAAATPPLSILIFDVSLALSLTAPLVIVDTVLVPLTYAWTMLAMVLPAPAPAPANAPPPIRPPATLAEPAIDSASMVAFSVACRSTLPLVAVTFDASM